MAEPVLPEKDEQTGLGAPESCPQCGSPMVIREGKYGRFLGCTNFPRCRWSGPLVVGRCPECWEDLVEKKGAKGVFWGCSGYPKCDYTQPPPSQVFRRVFGKPRSEAE